MDMQRKSQYELEFIYDIWTEGYHIEPDCEGQAVPAKLIRSGIKGKDFFDACRNWARLYPDEAKSYGGLSFVTYEDGTVWPTCWCCRLFSNERDARKSFG